MILTIVLQWRNESPEMILVACTHVLVLSDLQLPGKCKSKFPRKELCDNAEGLLMMVLMKGY